ncbi:receptor-type tyrosine-protein phosphatase eta-like [Arapaima gigas]
MGRIALLLLMGCLGGWAELQYYKYSNASTWEDARQHCSVCYKELVSLNSENIHLIVQNLSTDYWVGLRKDLNGTMSWSVWSNGDPVTFQNWYPGHPTILKEIPPTPTTPTPQTSPGPQPLDNFCHVELESLCRNLTNSTEIYIYDSTKPPSPVTQPQPVVTVEPEPIIENPCTSLLSFGMWMEKNCSELQPYICYEDRFYGTVNFSRVTLNSVFLNWTVGPGNIDHYRLELRGDINITNSTTSLSMDIFQLTPGTLYHIQVFAVKCERDLDPQNTSFYTKPDVIENLTVTEVKTDSIQLSWVKPNGNHDFYSVHLGNNINNTVNSTTENCLITSLSPGRLYYFQVYTEVKDQSIMSDPKNISSYTRPNQVINLTVFSCNSTWINLTWNKNEEVPLIFLVVVSQNGNFLFNQSTNYTNMMVESLTPGNKYDFTVVPQVPDLTLTGENATTTGFTRPCPVSNLTLKSNETSITATWNLTKGNFSQFSLTIQSTGKNLTMNTTSLMYDFTNLKAAARYSVTVSTVVGQLSSDPINCLIYTLPVRPGKPSLVNKTMENITIRWEVPDELNSGTTQYLVNYSSSFWNYSNSVITSNNTITAEFLKSGTYYTFFIQTLADRKMSDPVNFTEFTEPRKKTLTITMQCSSDKSLFCESKNASSNVYAMLQDSLNKLLTGVYYQFQKKT